MMDALFVSWVWHCDTVTVIFVGGRTTSGHSIKTINLEYFYGNDYVCFSKS